MNIIRCCCLCFFYDRNIDGLHHFAELEELFLDNNEISEESNLPLMSKLHTLTLNKNNVSFIVSPDAGQTVSNKKQIVVTIVQEILIRFTCCACNGCYLILEVANKKKLFRFAI